MKIVDRLNTALKMLDVYANPMMLLDNLNECFSSDVFIDKLYCDFLELALRMIVYIGNHIAVCIFIGLHKGNHQGEWKNNHNKHVCTQGIQSWHKDKNGVCGCGMQTLF
jgi:hypothetical protein